MDSNKDIKDEKIVGTETSSGPVDDSVKKENQNDMKKFITKVDNRVKTKVNI